MKTAWDIAQLLGFIWLAVIGFLYYKEEFSVTGMIINAIFTLFFILFSKLQIKNLENEL